MCDEVTALYNEILELKSALAEEKNKTKRQMLALRDAEAQLAESKLPENRGIGDSDIVEALKELDYLRAQLKKERAEYKALLRQAIIDFAPYLVFDRYEKELRTRVITERENA